MMATLFRNLSALVFDGITTAERDALNVQERMFIFNTTTQQFEVSLSGIWYGLLRLDTNGRISSAHHGAIGSGDLHGEYARVAAPEEITTGWLLKSGGSVKATAGDPPTGEVLGQVKTTTGAPTHSASAGVSCWVLPDDDVYVNNDGGTGWTKQLKKLGGNWKVPYSDGSGNMQELALGADGAFLRTNGAAAAPSFVGVVKVQATAPPSPVTGEAWLDTSTSGTGTESLALVTKTAAYTATDSDTVILCDATAGAFTVTLPTAVGRTGKVFYIKKIDATANAVTIAGDGAETIDGETTQSISTQYNALKLISDGSEWHIL